MTIIDLKSKIKLRPLAVHVLFWICTFWLGIFIHYWYYQSATPDYIFASFIDHLFYVFLVSVHFFLLLPALLEKGRYLWFLTAIIPTFIIIISFKIELKSWLGISFMGGYHEVLQFTVLALVYGALLTSMKLFKKQQENQKLKLLLEKTEKEKLSAELNALKAQIHPHFLFNTLNNIYSLSVKKSDKTSDYILILSQLMSYIIYESAEPFVELKKEMNFIEHYIALEKIRLNKENDISFSIQGNLGGHKIAPLLLISLVENAFTHGAKSHNIGFKLTAEITSSEGNTVFHVRCENAIELTENTSDMSGGIGLKNLKERLEGIYPGKHDLKISQTNDTYCADLTLIINTN